MNARINEGRSNRPKDPYAGFKTTYQNVGYVDPNSGDFSVVGSNDPYLRDKYIARGYVPYQGNPSQLTNDALNNLTNDPAYKQQLMGYGSVSQDAIRQAQERLKQYEAYREYAKPVSSGASQLVQQQAQQPSIQEQMRQSSYRPLVNTQQQTVNTNNTQQQTAQNAYQNQQISNLQSNNLSFDESPILSKVLQGVRQRLYPSQPMSQNTSASRIKQQNNGIPLAYLNRYLNNVWDKPIN